jgi:hypothetical protein
MMPTCTCGSRTLTIEPHFDSEGTAAVSSSGDEAEQNSERHPCSCRIFKCSSFFQLK